jgi:hypothetical protein
MNEFDLNMTFKQMPTILPSENEITLWLDGLFQQQSKPFISNEDINNYP